jgi:putative transposase
LYSISVTNTETPTNIIQYCRAILSAPWRFSIVYLSQITGASHDRLTRSLQKKYSWKKLFKLIYKKKALRGGYLIIDETDIDKSFAKKIKGLGWIFSHRKNHYIFGLHMVVLVWTNGKITIPLSWKIYKKGGDKTKIDLGLELLRYGLFVLHIKPEAVLFDAFYASEDMLKFLINHNQVFYSQLPKNRLFNHRQLHTVNNGRPYWTGTGVIKGSIKVQVVRNRKKYYATNNIGVERKKQLATYKLRWKIEEVFRFVKAELGFEKCQSRSLTGQNNHFGVCLFLYSTLQDIAEKTQMTVYELKKQATFNMNIVSETDLSVYMDGA